VDAADDAYDTAADNAQAALDAGCADPNDVAACNAAYAQYAIDMQAALDAWYATEDAAWQAFVAAEEAAWDIAVLVKNYLDIAGCEQSDEEMPKPDLEGEIRCSSKERQAIDTAGVRLSAGGEIVVVEAIDQYVEGLGLICGAVRANAVQVGFHWIQSALRIGEA
jgi:hypothetical protein